MRRPETSIREGLRPLLASAVREHDAIVDPLGGEDAITPQRLALVDSVVRPAAIKSATLLAWAQATDTDLPNGSASGRRRQVG
jgi:hypothetical protein